VISVLVKKVSLSQQFRTQEKNREDALVRLKAMIKAAILVQKVRRATKPSKGAQKRRLHNKAKRSQLKVLRGRVSE
jgi:ribosome-associated protein